MSSNYAPSPGASLSSADITAFLSQRDLALQVPINFVTAPGVSLTSACFARLSYEDGSTGVCLSNLLAVGFRRFEIDLFWDQERSLWSLCPVAIPISVPDAVPSTHSGVASSISQSALTSAAAPTGRVSARQATGSSARESSVTFDAEVTTSVSTSLKSIVPTYTAVPGTTNETLVKLGPFSCTTTVNLPILLSQLLDYIQQTETTLAAHLLYLVINLHAASSSTSPTLPAPSPTSLPSSSSLLGSVFSSNLTDYLYTPNELQSDRANLNDSWYAVSDAYRPTTDYYATSVIANDILMTDSGWPSEDYVEFTLAKRLLLQWGSVDPQMADYNFTADAGIIFSNGYLQDNQDELNIGKDGVITRGCYTIHNTGNLSISNVNSSWATVAMVPGFEYANVSSAYLTPTLNLTSNLTNCGISSILNITLLGSTADENYVPYSQFAYSSMIWSWAQSQPENYSSETDSSFSCATCNLGMNGRWAVSDCSQTYYAACRATGQPYNWTLTGSRVSYSDASEACPDPYTFAAPRTALENSYLTQAMRLSQSGRVADGVWVDFNSLNTNGCWVTGGESALCPYLTDNGAYPLDKQTVLVPTIAAIIVLFVSALTVFVKIAGHRRVRRRTRKRADNGPFYEGVPS